MSDKHERHGMSRAAELLAGLGTNKELGRILGKSAGTIGDYRTGRRRPAPEVMAAIERRWPQVASELWDAPPRAGAGPQASGVEPSSADEVDDDVGASEDASEGDYADRLLAAFERDLERLEGPEGDRMEPGARATALKKLADGKLAIDRAGAGATQTPAQILSSQGGKEVIAILTGGLAHLPTVVWAIEHAVRSLTTGSPSAELLPRHMSMAAIECRTCEERRRAEAEAAPTELIESCALAHGCTPRQLLRALEVTPAALRAADAWRARQERLRAHPERYLEPESWPLPAR